MSNNNKLESEYTYPADDNDNNDNTTITTNTTTDGSNNNKSEWEKYLDSLDEARLKQLTELAKLKTYKIEGQEYERKKIKVKQFIELERLRAKFTKEKDPIKSTEFLIDVYAKCAEYYLGLAREDYENMDWELTKPILDACNFRSVRGLPN